MTQQSETTDLFDGLKAVVQYRRKDWLHGWIPMLAFDIVDLAHKEAQNCSENVRPWIYRVAEITDDGIVYHPEIQQPFIKEGPDAA